MESLSDYRWHELSAESMRELVLLLPESSANTLLGEVERANSRVARAYRALNLAQVELDAAQQARVRAVNAARGRIEKLWSAEEIHSAIKHHENR